MIAPRYLPTICVLLALASVPTFIHSYSGAVAGDSHTAVISTQLAGFSATPTGRGVRWGKRRFNSEDWIERDYRKGDSSVRLTVVRSHDPKSLYHHPELAIADGTGFAGERIVRAPARPEVPIHVLHPADGVEATAAYVLHYGDRFVDNPITFQLRTAGELLISPRQMMTILFAFEGRRPQDGAISSAMSDLLVAALDDFLGQRPNPANVRP
jgi:hypothetical protein